ncbi:3-phosphoshikimate 1-carboxyvinyltransferase [Treponema zioleckii]|uniref:3-phosphoshikimate 1-carboxyvinyltransferase n=1 Tax=Treponema zioleckii TaxID=331680 RepID=UPI00168AA322|nr:3-phosphoshikimate 1-carboxyvinyltransferase [Treponema zioleckii]
MKVIAKKTRLFGTVTVPGSKSHTIRALLLATLADGVSHIKNPLPSADCLSTAAAVPLIGSGVDLNLSTEGEPGTEWIVDGAGKNIHLPDDVINVGNSGSLLYFLSPISGVFTGTSVFTGDASIRKRPVNHVVDVLNQLGAECFVTRPGKNGCPLVIRGPITKNYVKTEGSVSSQYISGLMMAGILLKDGIKIELTNPKETPYLVMTQKWLEKVGVEVSISEDFKHIEVKGAKSLKAFETVIPSDWEAVAFPLVGAIISDSEITIDHIDGSGTQGDDAIVEVLKSVGADIEWNKTDELLKVRGGKRLSTENLPNGELHVALSPFPDAVCALAVAACFIEGTTVLEDAAVCRRKETDRLKVLNEELTKLGAELEEGEDFLRIHGHSPILADGSKNPEFRLHGGNVESYFDHRMAMSLSCMAFGLPEGEKIVVNNSECCSVSFPHFYEVMNGINAGFEAE